MDTETIDLTDPLEQLRKQTGWTSEYLQERLEQLNEKSLQKIADDQKRPLSEMTLSDLLYDCKCALPNEPIKKSYRIVTETIELSDDDDGAETVVIEVTNTSEQPNTGEDNDVSEVTETKVIEIEELEDEDFDEADDDDDDDYFDENVINSVPEEDNYGSPPMLEKETDAHLPKLVLSSIQTQENVVFQLSSDSEEDKSSDKSVIIGSSSLQNKRFEFESVQEKVGDLYSDKVPVSSNVQERNDVQEINTESLLIVDKDRPDDNNSKIPKSNSTNTLEYKISDKHNCQTTKKKLVGNSEASGSYKSALSELSWTDSQTDPKQDSENSLGFIISCVEGGIELEESPVKLAMLPIESKKESVQKALKVLQNNSDNTAETARSTVVCNMSCKSIEAEMIKKDLVPEKENTRSMDDDEFSNAGDNFLNISEKFQDPLQECVDDFIEKIDAMLQDETTSNCEENPLKPLNCHKEKTDMYNKPKDNSVSLVVDTSNKQTSTNMDATLERDISTNCEETDILINEPTDMSVTLDTNKYEGSYIDNIDALLQERTKINHELGLLENINPKGGINIVVDESAAIPLILGSETCNLLSDDQTKAIKEQDILLEELDAAIQERTATTNNISFEETKENNGQDMDVLDAAIPERIATNCEKILSDDNSSLREKTKENQVQDMGEKMLLYKNNSPKEETNTNLGQDIEILEAVIYDGMTTDCAVILLNKKNPHKEDTKENKDQGIEKLDELIHERTTSNFEEIILGDTNFPKEETKKKLEPNIDTLEAVLHDGTTTDCKGILLNNKNSPKEDAKVNKEQDVEKVISEGNTTNCEAVVLDNETLKVEIKENRGQDKEKIYSEIQEGTIPSFESILLDNTIIPPKEENDVSTNQPTSASFTLNADTCIEFSDNNRKEYDFSNEQTTENEGSFLEKLDIEECSLLADKPIHVCVSLAADTCKLFSTNEIETNNDVAVFSSNCDTIDILTNTPTDTSLFLSADNSNLSSEHKQNKELAVIEKIHETVTEETPSTSGTSLCDNNTFIKKDDDSCKTEQGNVFDDSDVESPDLLQRIIAKTRKKLHILRLKENSNKAEQKLIGETSDNIGSDIIRQVDDKQVVESDIDPVNISKLDDNYILDHDVIGKVSGSMGTENIRNIDDCKVIETDRVLSKGQVRDKIDLENITKLSSYNISDIYHNNGTVQISDSTDLENIGKVDDNKRLENQQKCKVPVLDNIVPEHVSKPDGNKVLENHHIIGTIQVYGNSYSENIKDNESQGDNVHVSVETGEQPNISKMPLKSASIKMINDCVRRIGQRILVTSADDVLESTKSNENDETFDESAKNYLETVETEERISVQKEDLINGNTEFNINEIMNDDRSFESFSESAENVQSDTYDEPNDESDENCVEISPVQSVSKIIDKDIVEFESNDTPLNVADQTEKNVHKSSNDLNVFFNEESKILKSIQENQMVVAHTHSPDDFGPLRSFEEKKITEHEEKQSAKTTESETEEHSDVEPNTDHLEEIRKNLKLQLTCLRTRKKTGLFQEVQTKVVESDYTKKPMCPSPFDDASLESNSAENLDGINITETPNKYYDNSKFVNKNISLQDNTELAVFQKVSQEFDTIDSNLMKSDEEVPNVVSEIRKFINRQRISDTLKHLKSRSIISTATPYNIKNYNSITTENKEHSFKNSVPVLQEKPSKPSNSGNSPFISNSLDEFLTDSKLNVSYAIPKSGAEEGLHKDYNSEENIMPAVIQEVKEEEVEKPKQETKFKAKTLAEKRKLLEGNKIREQKRLKNLKQLAEKQKRSYVIFKDKKIFLNAKNLGKCIAAVDSTISVCKEKNVQPTTPKKLTLLTELFKKDITPIKYRPGPLCKKPELQSQCSNWVTKLKRLPKVILEVQPEIGKPIPPNIMHLLPKYDGEVTESQIEFALSALITKPVHKHDSKVFKFKVPYENNRDKLMVRKRVQSILPNYGKLEKKENLSLEDQVSGVLENLITYVEIKEMAPSLLKYDEDFVAIEDSSLLTASQPDKHCLVRRKNAKKRSKTELELLRLSCKVVSVEVEDSAPDGNCHKAFCQLGCVCKSLQCETIIGLHCQKVKCMFQCTCPKERSNIVSVAEETIKLPAGTDLLATDTVNRIEDEAKRNLARVEREFTQTIIHTNDKTIVVGCGNKPRRATKAPKKYIDFFDDDIPDEVVATKRPKKEDSLMIPCEVALEKWNFSDVLPYCLVHHLYNCYCEGKAIFSCITPIVSFMKEKQPLVVGKDEEKLPVKKLEDLLNETVVPKEQPKMTVEESFQAIVRKSAALDDKIKIDESEDILFSVTGRPIRKKRKVYEADFVFENIAPKKIPESSIVESSTSQSACYKPSDLIGCARTRCLTKKNETVSKSIKNKLLSQDFVNCLTQADLFKLKLNNNEDTMSEADRLKTSLIETRRGDLKKAGNIAHKHKRKQVLKVRNGSSMKIQKTVNTTCAKKGVKSVFPGEIIVDDLEWLQKLGQNAKQHLEGYARILPWDAMLKGYLNKLLNVYCIFDAPLKMLLNVGQKLKGRNIMNVEDHGMEILKAPVKERAIWLLNQSENIRDIVRWLLSGQLPVRYKNSYLSFLLVETTSNLFEVRGLCTQGPNSIPLNKTLKTQDAASSQRPQDASDQIIEVKHRNMDGNVESLIVSKGKFQLRELIEDGFDDDVTDTLYMWVGLPEIFKVGKWRVIFLDKEFAFLHFKLVKYSIKCTDLVKLAKMAKEEKCTLVLNNLKIKRGYDHTSFGIYVSHTYQDRIFIGPYFFQHQDEDIETLSYINESLVSCESFSMMKKNKEYRCGQWMIERTYSAVPRTYLKDTIDLTQDDERLSVKTKNTKKRRHSTISKSPLAYANTSTSTVTSCSTPIPSTVSIDTPPKDDQIIFHNGIPINIKNAKPRSPSEFNRFIITNIPHFGYLGAYQPENTTKLEVAWPFEKKVLQFENADHARDFLQDRFNQLLQPVPDTFKIQVIVLMHLDLNEHQPINSDFLNGHCICGYFGTYNFKELTDDFCKETIKVSRQEITKLFALRAHEYIRKKIEELAEVIGINLNDLHNYNTSVILFKAELEIKQLTYARSQYLLEIEKRETETVNNFKKLYDMLKKFPKKERSCESRIFNEILRIRPKKLIVGETVEIVDDEDDAEKNAEVATIEIQPVVSTSSPIILEVSSASRRKPRIKKAENKEKISKPRSKVAKRTTPVSVLKLPKFILPRPNTGATPKNIGVPKIPTLIPLDKYLQTIPKKQKISIDHLQQSVQTKQTVSELEELLYSQDIEEIVDDTEEALDINETSSWPNQSEVMELPIANNNNIQDTSRALVLRSVLSSATVVNTLCSGNISNAAPIKTDLKKPESFIVNESDMKEVVSNSTSDYQEISDASMANSVTMVTSLNATVVSTIPSMSVSNVTPNIIYPKKPKLLIISDSDNKQVSDSTNDNWDISGVSDVSSVLPSSTAAASLNATVVSTVPSVPVSNVDSIRTYQKKPKAFIFNDKKDFMSTTDHQGISALSVAGSVLPSTTLLISSNATVPVSNVAPIKTNPMKPESFIVNDGDNKEIAFLTNENQGISGVTLASSVLPSTTVVNSLNDSSMKTYVKKPESCVTTQLSKLSHENTLTENSSGSQEAKVNSVKLVKTTDGKFLLVKNNANKTSSVTNVIIRNNKVISTKSIQISKDKNVS